MKEIVQRSNISSIRSEVKPENDPVNHPAHYNDGKIEVIDFIEDKGFSYNLGNAIKYISRAGKKSPDTLFEDLEKAIFSIEREIERLKHLKGV